MRVMIDGRRVHGQFTGIGEYVFQLLRRLPRLAPHWEVSAILTAEGAEILGDADIDPLVVPYTIEDHVKGDPWRQFALPGILRRRGIEVFHGPGYFIPFVTPGVKTVVTIHDLTAYRFPESNSWKFGAYMRVMTRLAVTSADLVLTDSEFVRQEVIQWFRLAPERIAALPLGVDERFFEELPSETIAETRGRHGLQAPFFFSSALMEPRKNIETLVEAYRQCLGDKSFPVDLALGGKMGWQTERLRAMFKEPALKLRVRQTGFLRRADQRALYQDATAYVIPSRYEGFGLPALEAHASGTRLLIAEVGSLPEVASPDAWRFDPGSPEQLADLLRRAAAEPLADPEPGRKHARRYLWDRVISDYVACLDERFGEKPKRT